MATSDMQKKDAKLEASPGDDYSSDKSSDEDDNRFMDINDLKNRQAKAGKDTQSTGKTSKSKAKAA